MARQRLDVGDFPKDMSAEQLWTALKKSEENFAELYRLLGLVNLQNYVKKSGDKLTGTLTLSALTALKFDDPLGYRTNKQGDIYPYETAAREGFSIYDAAGVRNLRIPFDGSTPSTIYDNEILHTANGGGQVEDVPVYSTVKILAVKPFRELYAELDRNVSVTLTLPEERSADFAPTVQFNTVHKGAGWKLSFTQAVRWVGGVAPTQVTTDGIVTIWTFHCFKGIWVGAYNIAR